MVPPARRRRGRLTAVAVALALPLTFLTSTSLAVATTTSPPPNILLLISDDQAWTTFDRILMPSVFRELVDDGVLFDRAYVNTSLCCPSRSQMLTGLYEHHTGVDTNKVKLFHPTIVQALHNSGYRTMLTGKYLNSLPCTPRSEFDHWACLTHESEQTSKVDPTLNVDGQLTKFTGYQTDVLADLLNGFIAETPTDVPFFAMWTPTVPHLPVGDTRYDGLEVPRVRGPAYNMDTLRPNWPAWTRELPLTGAEKDEIDSEHQLMAEAVRSMDDAVASILDSLGDRAADTLVIYISDNGFQYGEHRRTGKNDPFEPSVRVPLVVRLPGAAAAGTTSDALVENIDVTSTIAEAAGIPWAADGASLLPLVRGEASSIRDALLIERRQGVEGLVRPRTGYEPVSGRFVPPAFAGVITDRWKYVETWMGERLLFDLRADPDETVNLADTPENASIQDELAATLSGLLAPPAPDTTIVEHPPDVLESSVARFVYTSQSRFASFRCRMTHDGSVGAWHPCDAWTDFEGGLTDGSWTFEVAATDETGATDRTPASWDMSLVTTGPPVEITASPPDRIASGPLLFRFTSPVSDATFECQLARTGKSGTWSSCTSPFEEKHPADGTWQFRVRATDPLTHKVTRPAASRIVVVDSEGPGFVAVRRPPEVTSSRRLDLLVSPTEPVADVVCSLDGGPELPCDGLSLQATGLATGTHSALFSAVDALGNAGSTTFSWRIDRKAPKATIVSGPDDPSSSSTAKFRFDSSDADPMFVCSLDGSVGFPCIRALTIEGLAAGPHEVEVAGIDRALNESATDGYAWTVTP